MEETYVMNQCKEDLCFVSTDFDRDHKIAKMKWPRNTIVRDYILPDYTTVSRGLIRTLDQSSANRTIDKDQVCINYTLCSIYFNIVFIYNISKFYE